MKGSVTKYTVKGSSRPRWRYRIDAGRDSSGRRLYDGAGGFAKEGEARQAMKAYMERLAAAAASAEVPPPAPAEKTVAQWLRAWLDSYAEHTCTPKTLERYRQRAAYVTDSADPEIGALANAPILRMRRKEIKLAMFALLRAKGKRREHISPRTVRHVAALLSSAFSEAVELEVLPANPMLRLRGLPAAEKTELRALTPDKLHALRETAAEIGHSPWSRSEWRRVAGAVNC
jgi:hypothetical protein